MGRIWIKRAELVGATGELTGYKSGLALTRQQLAEYIPANFLDYWNGDDQATIAIRSKEYENLIVSILFKLGSIPSPVVGPPVSVLWHRFRSNPRDEEILFFVVKVWIQHTKSSFRRGSINRSHLRNYDPSELFGTVRSKYGDAGCQILQQFLEQIELSRFVDPWSQYRRVEWTDTIDLQDLFDSENLTSLYGTFIDQRFIDYLAKNFEAIDTMNWRKFEGLTGEFFVKAGFEVEMGPGRNDNGVDIRVWSEAADTSEPALIIVQCKRHGESVGKTVLKALYADLQHENANSGLIVATHGLTRGAEQVRIARGYPIGVAGRSNLRAWIQAMRTPGAGVA